jgi:S-adenosylmethionine:tRNA ribosyltransferase-isomerase
LQLAISTGNAVVALNSSTRFSMEPWIDYDLPQELVAQEPVRNRVDARLMVVDRAEQRIQHAHIRDLPELLRQGDRVVLNDTKVIPAQLRGERMLTGGRWQGLFLGLLSEGDWLLVCKTRGTVKPPEPVALFDREGRTVAKLWLVERLSDGQWRARLDESEELLPLLDRIGRVPLPPYIRGGHMVDDDVERYQTVFARDPGAVAAPTAGLHFTPSLLRSIAQGGVEFSAVTLHVGLGTFKPIETANPADHPMHAERAVLSVAAAREINETKSAGGRIVAVGTTVVRVLETAALEASTAGNPTLSSYSGETRLFIRPPYEFKAVDALLTNFHFPRTTLLLLVQAFGGTELIRRAYDAAITEQYRFYSYGDAMLIQ